MNPPGEPPTARRVRVVLIESHDTLRALLADQLRRHDAIEVIGVADNVDDGLNLALELVPDVAVLDHSAADAAAHFSLGAVTTRNPAIRWIVLSPSSSPAQRRASRQAGAAAHLTKRIRHLDLAQTVLRVARGETGIGF